MALRQFEVGGRRGLRLAAASDLPNVVGIAGPNGSGKSALLELLWQQRGNLMEAGSETIYVGPNRTWRAGPLNDIAVRTFHQDYEQVLKQESLPGFQYIAPGGFNWLSGMSRFGSNADDAQALVKTAIVRMGNKFQTLLSQEYRRQGGHITAYSVPDLMSPLAQLVDTLLPHLRFVEINDSDPNNIHVLFEPRDNSSSIDPFDIDELSSGEKAAIALFLPFIERQVKALAKESVQEVAPEVVPLTVILDEPELHLHPLLQLNMLEYMRHKSDAREAQFIFTTHSPTLLDALDPEELFLLSPASIVPDNQLARLTQSAERLEVARSITGSTHLLTRSKPIVFIEGEPDSGHTASDERLIKLILPAAEHWALVTSGGRSQVVSAVKRMRAAELGLPGTPVYGLVDSDQAAPTEEDAVIPWPVAMIENLLLDADIIATVLAPYSGITNRDADGIRVALRSLAEERRDDEVRLRVKAALPTVTLRPEGTSPKHIWTDIEAAIDEYKKKVTATASEELFTITESEVDRILADGTELELFRGKQLLRALYDKLKIGSAGLGWNAFTTELARQAAGTERVERLTTQAVEKIRLYFPHDLVSIIKVIGEHSRADLIASCESHRKLWEQGKPDGNGREKLRSDLMHFGREIRDAGDQANGIKILELAPSIGTLS